MAGYFRDADATAAALRGGWLHTGDVGHLDDAGRLQVLDRRTDLVVTGGENVYPTEVETVLRAHPDVADAAVFGVRDAEWGRCVHAAVVPRADAPFDEAALRRWCRDRLAGFKTPRTIVMVDALPRTASGKLRRSVLAR
jgi:acyl-CoA synthetase (AMP-forming)/AMP-acid ligase II